MERERLRTSTPPSVEEQVNRVISAGEQARQNAGNELERAADKAESSVRSMARQADEATGDLKSQANELKDKAGEVASDLKDKASDLTNKAGEVATDLKDKAGELGAQAADKANVAMTATGERMENLAHTVREHAPSGKVGEIAATAATALERSGTYLQQADLTDVRTDLATLIRRHPVESLLVGVGLGFLVARSLRR